MNVVESSATDEHFADDEGSPAFREYFARLGHGAKLTVSGGSCGHIVGTSIALEIFTDRDQHSFRRELKRRF